MTKRSKSYYYRIVEELRSSIGEPVVLHQSSPLSHTGSALEVLLATILTQATSDKNALHAWLEFKKVFVKPEQVLDNEEFVLYSAIHSAGLAKQKTKVIYTVLQKVKERFNTFSLASLKNSQEAWEFLNQLPGVGPKTAACTMLFGLGLPQFPVDVHIKRIVNRLGWISGKVTYEECQAKLSIEIPKEIHSDLHILLLNLGRHYCRPSRPGCGKCPIGKFCPKLM
jgi:endonuclease-3